MSIGEVAREAGIGIETIRFYERKGLIKEPPRKISGYRQYPTAVVNHLLFIKTAKELGFSLKEISELLSLKLKPTGECKVIKMKAQEKIEEIEGKIRTLQKMKSILGKLTKACPGEGSTNECPILDAISIGQKSKPNG